MATISTKDIAELRNRTGAGMMDCKKALEETGGNIEEAIAYLRKKGIAKAEKRVGRAASEGKIVSLVSPDHRHAVLVELNSETDFVARNEEFGRLAEDLAQQVMQDEATDAIVHKAEEHALFGAPWHKDGGTTVGEVVKAAAGKTGENVSLRRFARFKTDGAIGTYVHFNGKVASLVEVGGAAGSEVQQLAKSIAEHIAAGVPTVPLAVTRDQVSPELVEKERQIFAEQARTSGKPENIIEKMIGGRIDKYYGEVALLEQPWVRDPSKTIRELVQETGKQLGAELSVRRFARFQMGEE
jgi:elongation factor Ts